MINKFIELLEDFKEFRRVRRSIRTTELSTTHKTLILSYNTQYEREINSLILRNLSDEMISGRLSAEYIRGVKSCLTWRLSYLTYKNHLTK